MEVSGTVESSGVITKRNFTLQELVQHYEALKISSAEGGSSEVSEDIQDLYYVARTLMEGKLDRSLTLRERLMAHNAACEKQIEFNNWMIKQIENMVEEATKLTETKRIDGLAYHVKMKKNPPAVIFKNEGAIPEEYKNYKFGFEDTFAATDRAKFYEYASFVLKREVTSNDQITPLDAQTLAGFFEKVVDKRKLSAELKKNPVEGAMLMSGEKLDIKSGRAVIEG